MLLGAVFALVQTDLKRALAWSTVSQLAFMFAALAAGDREAATNHLLSHGAFKALLFLGCGCLMQAVGSSSLSSMGGLRRAMPITFVSMTIGFAALAGVLPTDGFFSKDGVLDALRNAADGSGVLPDVVGEFAFYVALATSLVTAAYATRLWLVAFFGDAKEQHEAPRSMIGPVVVLAGATFVVPIGQPIHAGIGLLSTAIAAAGIGMVVWTWRTQSHLDIDAPLLTDELGLDAPYARGLPALVGSAARLVVSIDRDGVDVYPRSSATVAQLASRGLDLVQSRNVQRYATVIAAGVALLTAAAVIWT
jgi:NADH-quinone oxidoreductase subunit L